MVMPVSAIGKRVVFVMMPSGSHNEYAGGIQESDFIYQDIILPALKASIGEDMEVIRETDNRSPGAITRELIRHIATADVCIVDVTGLNPNVFLELGVRYALRKSTTILLRQFGTTLPFDINDYRCVDYSPLYKGPSKAVVDISETIQAALAQYPHGTDSLVFSVLSDLYVRLPGVIEAEDDDLPSPSAMPWAAYWDRLREVVARLHDVFQDGVFVPSVILGISNGGLIYADLLGRLLFKGIPILSLWANRLSRDADYFTNSINDATL